MNPTPHNASPSSITPTIPPGIPCPGPPGIPGTPPSQYDVNTIATCDVPFPVSVTSLGVITQLKYCGALDVHPNPAVPGTVLDSVSPTTIFPPGAVLIVVEYPGPVPKLNVVVVNVAVTDSPALIVTTHVPVVFVHAPVHPANADPVPGVAVSVTTVPLT
jgi:hypothetical protein